MKKYISIIKLSVLSSMILFTPFISFAKNTTFGIGLNYGGFGYGNYAYGSSSTLTDIIYFMINLINQAVVLVLALALLFFFWGVAKFILNADNDEKRTEGKKVMIWGIIALFVMVSVWGLVNILANTFF
jgi:phosphatidylglycerophosphatase A